MNGPIEVIAVPRTRRQIDRFLRVAYPIYAADPHWVAPLLMDLRKVFTDANPLFTHAEMNLWIARQNGRDVGRIAAVVEHTHNQLHHDRAAFFGFFESLDHAAVANALFDEVAAWAQQRQLARLLGPVNPTSNDECGLLLEGFDSPPLFMMTYNPPYYPALFEQYGFRKSKDLLAFLIELADLPMDRLRRIAAKVRTRNPEVALREVRRRTLSEDLAKVKEVYNAAWEDNWAFVPMTDGEIEFLASRLKPLLMEGLLWLAEVGTEPVGFLLALPDYNVAFQKLRGRLLTPQLIPAAPYLLGWKRPPMVRVLTLGVKRAYRGRGLETAMLIEGLRVGCAAGFTRAEASWILEDNVMMSRLLETIGGKPYKRYRIYEKELNPANERAALSRP